MKSKGYWILFFVLTFVGQSCLKVKTYPDTPRIKVLSSEVLDTLTVKSTIEFTDGDGDIGLGEGDTLYPYDPSSKYYNNLLVTYYVDTDGVWRNYAEFGYRVIPITPKGKIKVLEGEIDINAFVDNIPGQHKIKYGFVLVDKALHESNVAETAPITVGN